MIPKHTQTNFWWRADAHDLPQNPDDWWLLGDDGFVEQPWKLNDASNHFHAEPPDWSDDLLRVARAVFLADKLVERHTSAPVCHWTRHLRLSIPVSDPDAWRGAARWLRRLLQTLTGDCWDTEFHPLPRRLQNPPLPAAFRAGEVTLFSGGLDSLSWAAQSARGGIGEKPLRLVMFIEKGFRRHQERLLGAVQRLGREHGREVWAFRASQNPSGRCGRVTERSSRPRGLLYTAAAVRAAAADGVSRVAVPENGQLAINPPLSPSRSAALSTRTVHPWTLYLLNELIRAIDGTVTVWNPLEAFTKGEVCRQAVDAGLDAADLSSTMSCGAPPRRHNGGPFDNCGVCFPCLIRRSGLLHSEVPDYTEYETAPWILPHEHKRLTHWNALCRWLADDVPYSAFDLIADQPLPPGARPGAWIDTIERGRLELRKLVRVTQSEPVQRPRMSAPISHA